MKRAVLVFSLESPFQSWSDSARHTWVPTRREPTKSGIAGLICLATGRDFSDDAFVASVASCELVTRADREGSSWIDFHVTRDVPTANGEKKDDYPVPTRREYLEGASFKVALGGDVELLREIEEGLMFPAAQLWLGKKACQPSRRVWLDGGLVTTGETPREVLARWPWRKPRGNDMPEILRLTLDLGPGSVVGELRHDYPISLNPNARRFVDRRVGTAWVRTIGLPIEPDEEVSATSAVDSDETKDDRVAS